MKSLGIVFLILMAGGLNACQQTASNNSMTAQEATSMPKVTHAVAVLYPTQGHGVKGVVHFYQTPEGTRIVADVEGFEPGTVHGFHIHEWGDCSAPDGTSAGGHFNPKNKPHGAPDSPERHVGDLGNLEADNEGKAHYERIDREVELNGPYSVIGRGMIVHAQADDFKTQPTGNAGARMACGVIGIAKPVE